MRNLILLLMLIGVVSSVQAQRTVDNKTTKTSAGRWALAIETDNLLLIKKVAGSGNDQYLRKIMPSIGYLATSNLLLGLGIPVGLSPRNGTYYSSGTVGLAGVYSTYISPKQIGVAPFVQQFFGKRRVKPYV